jgi:hypothetical protein
MQEINVMDVNDCPRHHQKEILFLYIYIYIYIMQFKFKKPLN